LRCKFFLGRILDFEARTVGRFFFSLASAFEDRTKRWRLSTTGFIKRQPPTLGIIEFFNPHSHCILLVGFSLQQVDARDFFRRFHQQLCKLFAIPTANIMQIRAIFTTEMI
jgi:hypothetical protein